MIFFHIVIVTHNEEKVFGKCIQSILNQNYDDFSITVVDSCSDNTEYLKFDDARITYIFAKENIGYIRGINIGASSKIRDSAFTIFMNPDIILTEGFLSRLFSYLQGNASASVGILGPKLLRFNLNSNRGTNILDSAGIFQTFYGRWYDRGQNEEDVGQFDLSVEGEDVSAVCGGLMVCKSDVLIETEISPGEYFKNEYFMYKDDIELSQRVRRHGYQIKFLSHICAYHVRGWQSRKNMSPYKKLISAKNEIDINRQIGIVPKCYSIIKYYLVKVFNI